MKIILWSDNHNFPSLPLMKISSYHKAKGDSVKLYEISDTECDILYKSKTFSFSEDIAPNMLFRCGQIVEGGSGNAIKNKNGKEIYNKGLDKPLQQEIENLRPDYSLYPQYKEAYGFLTRGCPNNCSFCIVSKKEGVKSRQVADLSDFWDGQSIIKLMDGNLLACSDREKLLQQLIDSGAKIDYTQGLDARLITDNVAKLLCKTKTPMIHFAFDRMKDERQILKGLEIYSKYTNLTDRNRRVYILTNYDTNQEEDWYRVQRVRELGYQPYVMIYQKGTHTRWLTDLARWSNSYFLNRKCDFPDYIPRIDGKTCGELYGLT